VVKKDPQPQFHLAPVLAISTKQNTGPAHIIWESPKPRAKSTGLLKSWLLSGAEARLLSGVEARLLSGV